MDDATPKVCRKCGVGKPRAEFNRKTSSRDGLQPACRACVSTYNAELYQRDPAKVRARNDAWAAANPDRVRASARRQMARAWERDPAKMRAYHRSYHAANTERRRESIRECARRRRQADPEGDRAYLLQWRLSNPEKQAAIRARRRARKLAATVVRFTNERLAQRLSVWTGCWMCGGPKETIDHVKPLSRGGAHMLSNLRPACRSCNSTKRDRWPWPTASRRVHLAS